MHLFSALNKGLWSAGMVFPALSGALRRVPASQVRKSAILGGVEIVTGLYIGLRRGLLVKMGVASVSQG